MCICFSSEPPPNAAGRYGMEYRHTGTPMKTDMLHAPCAECPTSCCWFVGQFLPITCGLTQYMLRRKAINYDMNNYRCFQGQFIVCCCVKADGCGESSCPNFCLCMEAHLCNGPAVSASRALIMNRYDLVADPCDNQLVGFSNCMQYLTCICYTLAMFDESFRDLAMIIDWIADLVYHTVSGCMTAQVAVEINHQLSQGNEGAHNQSQTNKNSGLSQNNYGDGVYGGDNYSNNSSNPYGDNVPVAQAFPVGNANGDYGKYN